MIVITCLHFLPQTTTYMSTLASINVSILVCERQGRQSMRQLHYSYKRVEKLLTHLG